MWAKFDVHGHSHRCVCVLINIWNALVIFCYKYNTLSHIYPFVLCLVCMAQTMWNETRNDTCTNRVGHAQSKAKQLNRVWMLSIQRHIFFIFISFARRPPVIPLLSLSALDFGFYFRFHRLFRFRNDFRWCLWTLLFWYLNGIFWLANVIRFGCVCISCSIRFSSETNIVRHERDEKLHSTSSICFLMLPVTSATLCMQCYLITAFAFGKYLLRDILRRADQFTIGIRFRMWSRFSSLFYFIFFFISKWILFFSLRRHSLCFFIAFSWFFRAIVYLILCRFYCVLNVLLSNSNIPEREIHAYVLLLLLLLLFLMMMMLAASFVDFILFLL